MIDSWTCHICGEERPDSLIGVATGFIKDLPGAQINIRYCRDKFECEKSANEAALRGEFPSRRDENNKKRWWEFWK